jgi:TRAP-type C4-dicarboxylate transport system permease small subunit
MSDVNTLVSRPADPVGRVLLSISYWLAVAGGVLMAGLATMVIVSVLGRALFSAPIYGDFEMVAMGNAVGVSLFLPYCQMKKANVVVDLFLSWAPERVQSRLDGVGSLILLAISAMLTWRLWVGTFEMHEVHETTMILGITIWWAFPPITLSFAVLTLACLYTAVTELRGPAE